MGTVLVPMFHFGLSMLSDSEVRAPLDMRTATGIQIPMCSRGKGAGLPGTS